MVNNQRPYLFDQEFLKALATSNNRTIYIKIILLNLNEEPLEEIEGVVSQGSINIDGASAVRRTCNITMLSNDANVNSFLWGLNSRFKVEVGLLNDIDASYPEVCWFKQGTFLITDFSASKTTNSFSIQISGKDKMGLLNGEVGGVIQASTIFDELEEVDENGNIIYSKVPIETLIREAVHTYAKEPYSNIIIKDLDDYAFELREFSGERDLYIIGPTENYLLDNQTTIKFASENTVLYNEAGDKINLSDILDNQLYLLYDTSDFDYIPTIFYLQKDLERPVYVSKIDKNTQQAIGYTLSDLVYAGTLAANPGETIMSILDKIKNQLGMFEYFYNVDGQFVFQKKPQYLSYNSTLSSEQTYLNIEEPVFEFLNGNLVTNISNTPAFANIKNDYMVWGTKKSASGADIPIWQRVAIDEKPTGYNSPWAHYTDGYEKSEVKDFISFLGFDNCPSIYVWDKEAKQMNLIDSNLYNKLQDNITLYFQQDEKQDEKNVLENITNWREHIFRMAKDYYRYHLADDFLLKISEYNFDYPLGITGYEQYYQEMLEFYQTGPVEKLSTVLEIEPTENKHLGINYINYENVELESWMLDLSNGQASVDNNTLDLTNADGYAVDNTDTALTIDASAEILLVSQKKNFYNYNINGEWSLVENEQGILTVNSNYENKYADINLGNIFIEQTDLNGETTYAGLGELLRRESDYQLQVRNKITDNDFGKILGVPGFLKDIKGIRHKSNDSDKTFAFYEDEKLNSSAVLAFINCLENIDGNLSNYICYQNEQYANAGLPNANFRFDRYLIEAWVLLYGDKFDNDVITNMHYYIHMASLPYSRINNLGKGKVFFSLNKNKQAIDVSSSESISRFLNFPFDNMKFGKGYNFCFESESDDEDSTSKKREFLLETPFYSLKNIPPEDRNKWIDFIEPKGDLANYSVKAIGQRLKAENNSNIKNIGYKLVPNLLFIGSGEDFGQFYNQNKNLVGTYSFIKIPVEYENYFSISDRGKTAEDVVQDYLNKYTYANNTITFTTFPLYWLEPNNKIHIQDNDSGINGDYIITKLSIPLTYNGTTSVTANKIIENII